MPPDLTISPIDDNFTQFWTIGLDDMWDNLNRCEEEYWDQNEIVESLLLEDGREDMDWEMREYEEIGEQSPPLTQATDMDDKEYGFFTNRSSTINTTNIYDSLPLSPLSADDSGIEIMPRTWLFHQEGDQECLSP